MERPMLADACVIQVQHCNLHLVVGGQVVDASSRYCLRFADKPSGGIEAVLYHDGKRVVSGWAVTLGVVSPADPNGGNANTAG